MNLRAGPTRLLFSCLLIAAATFPVASAAVPGSNSTLVSTTTLTFSSVMENCRVGWTGIPFTGKVQVNVSSSSGPFDLYIFTRWEGEGQRDFESTVCFSNHPTSTSRNCGIVNTPPECIFTRAQVFIGSYNVDLPGNLGSYYYIVFTQCCSKSVNDSTLTVIIRGPSAPLSSFNQYSVSPFNLPSYTPSMRQGPISSFNVISYMPSVLRTNLTFSVPDPAPNSMPKLPDVTRMLESLEGLLPTIIPILILLSIEFAILSAQSIPFRRRKSRKTNTMNCAECGRKLSKRASEVSLAWDYCRVCERIVCINCLERVHNNRCEIGSRCKPASGY